MTELAPLPLPDVDEPLAASFWAACQQHRLELQRCGDCGQIQWPPRRLCQHCLSTVKASVQLSGLGTVWSYATYERALTEAFQGRTPYVVIVVELKEGPLFVSNLIGNRTGLAVGSAVRVHFVDVNEQVTLPLFELAC